jgi:hypothetical protein
MPQLCTCIYYSSYGGLSIGALYMAIPTKEKTFAYVKADLERRGSISVASFVIRQDGLEKVPCSRAWLGCDLVLREYSYQNEHRQSS